jgi:hypothetical protein
MVALRLGTNCPGSVQASQSPSVTVTAVKLKDQRSGFVEFMLIHHSLPLARVSERIMTFPSIVFTPESGVGPVTVAPLGVVTEIASASFTEYHKSTDWSRPLISDHGTVTSWPGGSLPLTWKLMSL